MVLHNSPSMLFKKNLGKPKYTILGMKRHDYSIRPATFNIIDGGFGQHFIVVNISTEIGSGIRSIVHFYGEKIETNFATTQLT